MPEHSPQLSVACLLITHLPVKAEMRRYPALRGRPVVIVENDGSGELALDSSAEAISLGITAGMPLPCALARCPDALLMQADTAFYGDTNDRLAEMLAMRCSEVESDGKGRFYAGLDGLSEFYGGEPRLVASLLQAISPGFNPRMGVASAKFPAYIAALTAPEGRAARTSPDTAAFLSGCSIDLLPVSPAARARLRRSGIRTLGRLAALTVGDALALLETEDARAWDLAHGIDRDPLPAIHRAAA